jgi:hypothetical protein
MLPAPDARLPQRPQRLLRGPIGRLLLRPWFDWVTLRWVTRVYFPLSRAWAAARAADGDPQACAAALGLTRPPWPALTRLVQAVAAADRAHRDAEAAWQAAFHADRRPPDAQLVAAELAREHAAARLMATRFAGGPLYLRRRLPAVDFRPVDRATLEAKHGARRADPQAAFPPPDTPTVRESHAVAGPDGRVSWIDWTTAVLGDRGRARVTAPPDAADPPTLIHLHGIAMELEMWRAAEDPVNALARTHGIRVVRPEGPWHGHRCPPGVWGGEPAVAWAPEGYLDLMQAWVAELGQLVAWARATSRGPVAIGGLSLGALTAQLAASVARRWPARLQPDALFLSMTSGDLLEVAFEGEMARRLGALDALHSAGWDHDLLARYRPLLEPDGPPAMGAARVVMHLGELDVVTPFAGGRRLAETWGVPAQNLFLRRRGHFSAPIALAFDTAPLARLVAVLTDRD